MKKVTSLMTFCLTLILAAAAVGAQSNAEGFYKSSQTRLASRDVDGAIADLDKAIELKPDLAKAYAQRGHLQMMKGRVEAALTDISRALEIDPEMVQAYAQRGRIRMMRNDMAGARADFDSAIARGYRNDEIFSSRGVIKMMSNEPEGAINDLSVAISLNPKRIGYYIERAQARSMGGDEAGALADLNHVIDQYEKRESKRAAAGKAKEQAPVFDLVSPTIKGPVREAPAGAAGKDAGKDSGKPVGKVHTDTVVTMKLDAAGAQSVEDFEYLLNVAAAYLNRGSRHSKSGDSEAAIKDFNTALSINPRDFGAYYSRGRERQKLWDLKGAYDDLTKSIESRQDAPYAYMERAVTLILMGRDEDAQKDFDLAVKLDPSLKPYVETRRAAALKKKEEKPQ